MRQAVVARQSESDRQIESKAQEEQGESRAEWRRSSPRAQTTFGGQAKLAAPAAGSVARLRGRRV